MIVRIMSEGQYRLTDEGLAQVNELDNACVAAVDSGDEGVFAETFAQLLDLVRSVGEVVPDDEIESSDVIIPPADTSLAEAAADFTGDGLIPD